MTFYSPSNHCKSVFMVQILAENLNSYPHNLCRVITKYRSFSTFQMMYFLFKRRHLLCCARCCAPYELSWGKPKIKYLIQNLRGIRILPKTISLTDLELSLDLIKNCLKLSKTVVKIYRDIKANQRPFAILWTSTAAKPSFMSTNVTIVVNLCQD